MWPGWPEIYSLRLFIRCCELVGGSEELVGGSRELVGGSRELIGGSGLVEESH